MGRKKEKWQHLAQLNSWGGIGPWPSTDDALLARWSDADLKRLQSWLEAIDCGHYFDRFVQAGYDFSFTAKVRDRRHQ